MDEEYGGGFEEKIHVTRLSLCLCSYDCLNSVPCFRMTIFCLNIIYHKSRECKRLCLGRSLENLFIFTVFPNERHILDFHRILFMFNCQEFHRMSSIASKREKSALHFRR